MLSLRIVFITTFAYIIGISTCYMYMYLMSHVTLALRSNIKETLKNKSQTNISWRIDLPLKDEVESSETQLALVNFTDGHTHNDKNDTAKDLYDKVKVLVWVMTTESNHQKKALHVKNTWGKRCNKLLFMSDTKDDSLPALAIFSLKGREHLTGKTMNAFDYIYENFYSDYDWFMKADDDTYVIVENLRYMLSAEDPGSPVFFGHHFRTNVKQGYFSGGGGYVISKEALRRFGERNDSVCLDDGAVEDVDFAKCMQTLGVVTGDSRDALNRSRFHCFPPSTHMQGAYPKWYRFYDKYDAQKGKDSISDYAVTFHYISPEQMNDLEYFVYHLRPYGVYSGEQNLNKKKNKSSLNSQTLYNIAQHLNDV